MRERFISSASPAVCFIGFGSALLILSLGCAPPTPEQQAARQVQAASDAKYGDESGARIAAQKVVKQFLKHPLDASFSWSTSARLTDPIGPEQRRNWVVSGTVKAPNDFGAELTKPYQVTLFVKDNQWVTLVAYYDGKLIYQDGKEIAAALSPAPSKPTPSAPLRPAAGQLDLFGWRTIHS